MNRMSACVDGVIACCQVVLRRIRPSKASDSTAALGIKNQFDRDSSRNSRYAIWTGREINFLVRKKSPEEDRSHRKRGVDDGDARDRGSDSSGRFSPVKKNIGEWVRFECRM